PVERQYVTAIGGKHGLMPFGTQVQNRHSPMPQGHAGFGIRPSPFVIRPAMRQRGNHTPGDFFAVVHAAIPRAIEKSGNAAHKRLTLEAGLRSSPHSGDVFARRSTSSRVSVRLGSETQTHADAYRATPTIGILARRSPPGHLRAIRCWRCSDPNPRGTFEAVLNPIGYDDNKRSTLPTAPDGNSASAAAPRSSDCRLRIADCGWVVLLRHSAMRNLRSEIIAWHMETESTPR